MKRLGTPFQAVPGFVPSLFQGGNPESACSITVPRENDQISSFVLMAHRAYSDRPERTTPL
jgi:hypothetical protein